MEPKALALVLSIALMAGCVHAPPPESATLNCAYDTGSEELEYTVYENCGYVAHEKIVLYPSHLKKLKYSAAGLAKAWI
jgi:hypothetical protein